jgi:hypothetical protein
LRENGVRRIERRIAIYPAFEDTMTSFFVSRSIYVLMGSWAVIAEGGSELLPFDLFPEVRPIDLPFAFLPYRSKCLRFGACMLSGDTVF